MQTSSLALYSFTYKQVKTYLLALAFVVGNIALPQLCHFVPQGGITWLPIYFFTLIGAYKYGWRVGVITALVSPIINHVLFGMPPLAVLPAILIKSTLLAIFASTSAKYFKRISVPIILLVVLTYQLVGTLIEWALIKDFMIVIQDFRIGIPGMLFQILGGYLVIKYLLHK